MVINCFVHGYLSFNVMLQGDEDDVADEQSKGDLAGEDGVDDSDEVDVQDIEEYNRNR